MNRRYGANEAVQRSAVDASVQSDPWPNRHKNLITVGGVLVRLRVDQPRRFEGAVHLVEDGHSPMRMITPIDVSKPKDAPPSSVLQRLAQIYSVN
jgi:hypothetical protein